MSDEITTVMPILTITLGLQFYDKAVLGSASVFGIIADLGLSEVINGATVTTRYSTATAAVSICGLRMTTLADIHISFTTGI